VRDIAAGATAASLAAVLAVSVAASTPPTREVARIPEAADTVALAGPVLSSARVVWGVREKGGDITVQLAEKGRVRTLFRVAPPPVPPAAAHPQYDATVMQRITALAASPSHIAFVRAVILHQEPRCRQAVPPCAAPSEVTPLFSQLWLGQPNRGSGLLQAGGRHRPERPASGRGPPTSMGPVRASSTRSWSKTVVLQPGARRGSSLSSRPLGATGVESSLDRLGLGCQAGSTSMGARDVRPQQEARAAGIRARRSALGDFPLPGASQVGVSPNNHHSLTIH